MAQVMRASSAVGYRFATASRVSLAPPELLISRTAPLPLETPIDGPIQLQSHGNPVFYKSIRAVVT